MRSLHQAFSKQAAFLLFLTGFFSQCMVQPKPANQGPVPAGGGLASSAVARQEKKVYHFTDGHGAVGFSNKFSAARLNQVMQVDDSTFALLITPESPTINPSPWYAFKVWSHQPQSIYLRLTYQKWRHRYHPKTSTDGHSWQAVPSVDYSSDSTAVTFRVSVSPDTTLVAAQEVITAADSYAWMDKLARRPTIRKHTIGRSLLSKPIVALTTKGAPGKKLIVVLSRQHPPEVTGYLAMQAFIERILEPSEAANNFRRRYEVVIIPMLNPDGVDNGHWRHSAAGVDLNRDWNEFKQPETAAVRTYLQRLIKEQQAKVCFAIDFHSTYQDVFYTNEDTVHTNLPGFTQKWLRAVEASLPAYKINVKASGNGSNVSKSWMMRELKAEALTYEVGDDTDRVLLKKKGEVAADRLMELLLKENQ
ncbi:peptidase M14 carboxypeptidase A [Hymenobacter roseosalivarius DSM 11622]|uniref:Peptidase M14 carboxypeptidase A n=1 Tax=Hymenobacter roseosalivarius DSM 11622 TaxID=645990 RepID=A0A1W1UGA6_9BACT|nr:M14 family metallopeptidase [Hymenobacter roseosalivarius]SMB80117.1 peptidase M14 carboxypeptidase A [Hymenobacter roseosalivarius DSM 11622]